jgi:hypothetical protein
MTLYCKAEEKEEEAVARERTVKVRSQLDENELAHFGLFYLVSK